MTGVPHRIRDFVVSKDGLVLSVLDYVPQEYYGGGEGIRSMLRYMPDEHGERIRRGYGKTYHKLTTEEALKKMRSIRPAWTKDVVVLPYDEVGEYLMPERELERVCEKDSMVSRLVSFFEEMGVSRKAMGITGSRLTSLSGDASDIDFVVYGKEWWEAREILLEVMKEEGAGGNRTNSWVHPVSDDVWSTIYHKREPDLTYAEFISHEQRKGNRGVIDGTYFDLLYVRSERERKRYNPPKNIKKIGMRHLTAPVVDATYSFDAPAIYEVEHPIVSRVISYTHTYSGQVGEGEVMEAQGMLEEVEDGYQIVVGTTREAKGEWIRSLSVGTASTSPPQHAETI